MSVADLDEALTPTPNCSSSSPLQPDRGRVLPDEVTAIGKWAAEKGIWVVTDEIYEHLVYGDALFSSMPVQVPEIADTCVVVNGWRRPTP